MSVRVEIEAAAPGYDARVRLSAAICGLLIVGISLYLHQVIERDAVLYLLQAKVFGESGFMAAFRMYNWPFYSVGIYWIHFLSGFSLENSAHLINALFILLLGDAFIRFYWEVNPDCRYRWMPAVVFLAYTGINDYRPDIIRDWGFWAFIFLSFYYFSRALKQDGLDNYVFWQMSAVAALLFRIEAAIFTVLALTFLIARPSFKRFVMASFVFWLMGVIIYVTGWQSMGKFKYLFSYLDWSGLIDSFQSISRQAAERVIPHHTEKYAAVFMLGGLFGVMGMVMLEKLGYGYLAILLTGLAKKLAFPVAFRKGFVLCLFLIASITVFFFFCDKRILAGRYVILMGLLLLIYVAFYSERFVEYCLESNKKGMLSVFAGLMAINLVAGLHHSESSKIYLKVIGIWARDNTPVSARVLSNDTRLCFYSERSTDCKMKWNARQLKSKKKRQNLFAGFEYLLVDVDASLPIYQKLERQGELMKIHSISGKKPGTLAVLYRIQST